MTVKILIIIGAELIVYLAIYRPIVRAACQRFEEEMLQKSSERARRAAMPRPIYSHRPHRQSQ